MMRIIRDVRSRISEHPDPDECWLRCDECSRFFQYKMAAACGNVTRDACPFKDCYGCGIGFNLFMWDDMREEEDPRWPSCVAELKHGARSPEMEPFYEEQLRKRIEVLSQDFAASTEGQEFSADEPARYIKCFLKMSSDLCWDLTETDDDGTYFCEEIARGILDQLPVWSQTANLQEVPRMLAELRCFFRFAERSGSVPQAKSWRELVDAEDLEDLLRYTMQNDPRLQKTKRRKKTKRLTYKQR